MAGSSAAHPILRAEGSDLSDVSNAIHLSPPHHRHGYQRHDSQGSIAGAQYTSPDSSFEFEFIERNTGDLGITSRPKSIARVPVGSRSSLSPPTPAKPFSPNPASLNSSPRTPGLSKPLISPAFQRYEQGYTYDGGGLGSIHKDGRERTTSMGKKTSFADGLDIASGPIGDARDNSQTRERSTHDDNDNDKLGLLDGCPAKHDIHSSRTSWLSISILILSIYSTIFSGIYLVLAIVQPRYGKHIYSGGSLTPSNASTLFALFAKTIELSFVTVFVTFLGQVLSRRSLVKASRGVTISELTMRTWVIQPGFMITHWQTLRHAVISILGLITLTAAFVAMFYTTASDTLVSPHLKYGNWENREMFGLVKTQYANPQYISASCRTPISTVVDPANAGLTCLNIQHAGQANHNIISFMDTWSLIMEGGMGVPSDLSKRPQAPAMLFDNTTVTGRWVFTDSSNMTAAYANHSRIINNVTLSMPHAGIFAAARDSKNGILQPEDLDGLGEYSVRASVVSPSVNVLCVNTNKTELDPLIYTSWRYANTTNNSDVTGQKMAAPGYLNELQLAPGEDFLNSTVLDDIFEWGQKYGRQPPLFPMLPMGYNSIGNVTMPQNHDSIYLLVAGPAELAITPSYTLCQFRSFLSPTCSSRYNVSGRVGGHLEANCEDPLDNMAYDKFVPAAPVTRWPDWKNVGSEWLLALALNTGISNANASNARLLSQLIPTFESWQAVQLPMLTPTIAEHLAVMVGNTLLTASMDADFKHFWGYQATILNPGNYTTFNASLASQEYTSGYTAKWQSIFYIVLALVFATNVFCLAYFFLRSGLVTDYTEPQNLFALAVNSPPSSKLSGSCGAGPEGHQMGVGWHVEQEEGTGHFAIKEGEYGYDGDKFEMGKRRSGQSLKTMSSYSKLSSKRRSFL